MYLYTLESPRLRFNVTDKPSCYPPLYAHLNVCTYMSTYMSLVEVRTSEGYVPGYVLHLPVSRPLLKLFRLPFSHLPRLQPRPCFLVLQASVESFFESFLGYRGLFHSVRF